jgi:hypothetical protein
MVQIEVEVFRKAYVKATLHNAEKCRVISHTGSVREKV